MIRDYLIPEVYNAFSGWEMQVNPESNPIVTFPAVQKEVGRLYIHDDGDEATVYVEKISHGHFNCYGGEALSVQERERAIAEDVTHFLQSLFSDRILLFTSADKRLGGWATLDNGNGPAQLAAGRIYYLWSKPYTV
jgi:hypothetical protein